MIFFDYLGGTKPDDYVPSSINIYIYLLIPLIPLLIYDNYLKIYEKIP